MFYPLLPHILAYSVVTCDQHTKSSFSMADDDDSSVGHFDDSSGDSSHGYARVPGERPQWLVDITANEAAWLRYCPLPLTSAGKVRVLMVGTV